MSILTIRKASHKEILEILSEPQICSRLDTKPGKILKDKSNNFALIIMGDYRLLVTYKKIGQDVIDCHLACPANSLEAARVTALIGMAWLLNDTNLNALSLTTSTMKGSMSNFAKKLGFVLIDSDDDKDYFVFNKY